MLHTERVNWGAHGLEPRTFESPDQIHHKHELLSAFSVLIFLVQAEEFPKT
jgi:hypothetical protein